MNARGLDGRVAVVTGAATGLGRGTAARLAELGAHVIVNHRHTPETADAVVSEITAAGGSARAVAADISNEAEFGALGDDVLATEGRWDVLVNNAAIAHTRPVGEFSETDIDAMHTPARRGA